MNKGGSYYVKKMTGETTELRSDKRKKREERGDIEKREKNREKQRKREIQREKEREKREKERKREKRCPGSININLHSIRKKKN